MVGPRNESGRILLPLVDDHELLRDMLAVHLGSESDMALVGGVGDADQAVSEAARLKPTVILMDIHDRVQLSRFAIRDGLAEA